MHLNEFQSRLNDWGQKKIPFIFWIDFELEKPVVMRVDEIEPGILFNLNGFTNVTPQFVKPGRPLVRKPVSLDTYTNKFQQVMDRLRYGDSFLINLTIKTEIESDRSLKDLFHLSKAKYKLFVPDQFLVFSPETFVRIERGRIFSFPMKGTIDAAIPGATDIILSNAKEKCEHVTIVDLIRNDLSKVSERVSVSRFRYVEEIKTVGKRLLQVSSEIVGDLPAGYSAKWGDIMVALLPAGSVSGAPKEKTLEIISQVEQEKRGYYTGTVGYFDGENLDSGVMIRFIEMQGDKLYYRSGGGITAQSDVLSEYQEAIDKVYVPIH